MKYKNILINRECVAMLVASLVFLPGCWPFGKSSNESVGKKDTPVNNEHNDHKKSDYSAGKMDPNVLVWVDNRPVVTIAEVEELKTEIMRNNPQLAAAMQTNSKEIERHLAEALATQTLVSRYVVDNKLDQTDTYKKDLARALKAVKEQIDGKVFTEQVSVVVSDRDVQEFYDSNKNNPGIMISQGGVKAAGVSFDSEAAANAFLPKVKAVSGDIEKAAKAANLTMDKVRDFKLVNDQSIGIEPALRTKILAISSVPSTQVIKVDNNFWVVHASAKEAPTYQELSKIKPQIVQVLEQNKRQMEVAKKLEELRKKYNMILNDSYFGGEKANAEDLSVGSLMTEDIDAFEDGK